MGLRQLGQEARLHHRLVVAVATPVARPQEDQPVARPRHPDVEEAPLFFDVRLGGEARGVRQQVLLDPRDGHRGELEPLGAVQGHERHGIDLLLKRIDVRQERDLLQEGAQAAVLRLVGEGLRRRYELLDVLAPGLEGGRIALAQVSEVVRRLEHRLHHLDTGAPFRHAAQVGEEPRVRRHLARGSGRQLDLLAARKRLAQAPAARAGRLLQARDRGVADAAPRHVEGALQGHRVRRVLHRLQVGHDVAHLAPLVEARAAHDLVRDVVAPERVLEGARLRVGAVEDRHVAPAPTLPHPLVHELRHAQPLLLLVLARQEPEGLAPRARRPELLARAAPVVGDEVVGGLEDGRRGAVVLLQLEDGGAGEAHLEVEDVAQPRPAPGVDGLVVVPHDEEVAVPARELLDEGHLDAVGVLELVDQDVEEALGVRAERLGLALEELDGAQEEVVEVEGVVALEGLVVIGVELRRHALDRVAGQARRLRGRDPLVLPGADAGPGHRRAHVPRVGAGPEELLEDRLGVGRVVDGEPAVPAEPLRLAPQDAHACRVERPQPHLSGLPLEEALDARAHLARRLVREGEGEDAVRRHAALSDEVRDARRNRIGPARQSRPVDIFGGIRRSFHQEFPRNTVDRNQNSGKVLDCASYNRQPVDQRPRRDVRSRRPDAG